MVRALLRALRRALGSGSDRSTDEAASDGPDEAADDDGSGVFAFSLLDRSVQESHGVQTDQPQRAIRELEAKGADLEAADDRRDPPGRNG